MSYDDEKTEEQHDEEDRAATGLAAGALGLAGIFALGPLGGIIGAAIGAAGAAVGNKARKKMREEDREDED